MPEVISLFSDSSSDDDFYDNFDKIKLRAAQKKRKQPTTSSSFKVRTENIGAFSFNLDEEILCVEDLVTLKPQNKIAQQANDSFPQIIEINDAPSCSQSSEVITLGPDSPIISKKNSRICGNIPSIKSTCTISIRSNETTRFFRQDMDDPIKNLIEEYAERANIDPKRIVLVTKELKRCALEDTPRTLGIVCGGNAELDAFEHTEDTAELNIRNETNTIRIKYQQKGKRTISTNILKTAKFIRLKELFCQENSLPLNKIEFVFDSMKIGDDETAETLELENDDCIDIYLLD